MSNTKGMTPFMVGLIVAGGIGICLLALMWPSTNKTTENATPTMELPSQQSLATQMPAVDEETFAGLDATQEDLAKQKLARLEEKLEVLHQQQLDLEQEVVAEEEPILAQAELSKDTQTTPAPTPISTPTKPLHKTVNKAAGKTLAINKQEKSILETNQQHYALQLIASSNEQKIRDFIAKNKLDGKAKYYKSVRNGKPWFTVVYGDFSNKNAALAEINKLPIQIKNFGPWVRKYSSIHASIQKHHLHE